MSTRIVGTCIAAVLALLSAIAAGQPVAPLPPSFLAAPRPNEVDKAFQYSTIGQELAYAKIRENAGGKRDGIASNPKPQIRAGFPSLLLPAPSGVSPLASGFNPAVSSLCPPPAWLVGRLEAAGYRR
jgi:hypothetical protein